MFLQLVVIVVTMATIYYLARKFLQKSEFSKNIQNLVVALIAMTLGPIIGYYLIYHFMHPDQAPPSVLSIDPINDAVLLGIDKISVEVEDQGNAGIDWGRTRLRLTGQTVGQVEGKISFDNSSYVLFVPKAKLKSDKYAVDVVVYDRSSNQLKFTSSFQICEKPSLEIAIFKFPSLRDNEGQKILTYLGSLQRPKSENSSIQDLSLHLRFRARVVSYRKEFHLNCVGPEIRRGPSTKIRDANRIYDIESNSIVITIPGIKPHGFLAFEVNTEHPRPLGGEAINFEYTDATGAFHADYHWMFGDTSQGASVAGNIPTKGISFFSGVERILAEESITPRKGTLGFWLLSPNWLDEKYMRVGFVNVQKDKIRILIYKDVDGFLKCFFRSGGGSAALIKHDIRDLDREQPHMVVLTWNERKATFYLDENGIDAE